MNMMHILQDFTICKLTWHLYNDCRCCRYQQEHNHRNSFCKKSLSIVVHLNSDTLYPGYVPNWGEIMDEVYKKENIYYLILNDQIFKK